MARETQQRPLAWLRVPGEDEVPDEVRDLWRRADERLGFVPNVLRVWALRPEHLLRWRKYMDALMKGESGLTEAEREMIGVVVSARNRCHYCITSHSGVLRELTGNAELVDRLVTNYRHAPLGERERAMLDFAVKMTEQTDRCEPADVDRLRLLGFSEEDVMDIAETAAMFNLTNRLANALGWEPNSEYVTMGR